ncbi:SMP-30/gluconolactonase/LRE family protein [Neptunicella sp. SCSIO 80796]|uniref:SMP-30/gluconolactonase/LRE family protein n=1 Tax=Neptunicella plasticusilytica TaxID=3117012 RepID=UPI003A4E31AD
MLGEGAYWHSAHQRIYWVDIKGAYLHWLNLADKQVFSLAMPEPICWVAATTGRALIAGFGKGIYLLNPDSGERRFYAAPDSEPEHNRLNDGKVDYNGGLWFGTMDDQEQLPSGHLYQLNSSSIPVCMDSGYVVSNGPTFCPLTQRLLHADSANRTIYQFALDPQGGLHNKAIFTQFSDSMGFPDGMTVDAQGGIWVAQWGGGGICRFDQQGQLDLRIELPATLVTSLVFGGENLRTLFVTTATKDLEPDVFDAQPNSGQLFEIDMSAWGFNGLAPVAFKL